MKNKDENFKLASNVQNIVNTKHGIILSSEMVKDPTDHHQLIPQIEKS